MNRFRSLATVLMVAVFLALGPGTPATAEEVWVAPTHFLPEALDIFPWSTTGSGFVSFGFSVPDDMESYVGATIVLIPASGFAGNYDAYANVKSNGELAGDGTVFSLAIPVTVAASEIAEVDISGLLAGEIDSDSAGADYVSVFFWFPTSPGLEDAKILGMRFIYDSVHQPDVDSVDSNTVVDNSLSSADIQNGGVTNADLANSAVNSVKIQDNTVASSDIQNGTITAADINTGQVQVRVAGSCPAGQSMRAVASNGAVVCEVDTAGMLFYDIQLFNSSCANNSACWFVRPCAGGRRIMGGGFILDETFDAGVWDNVDVVESGPVGNTAWRAAIANRSGGTVNVDVTAICSALGTGASSTTLREEPAQPESGTEPLPPL